MAKKRNLMVPHTAPLHLWIRSELRGKIFKRIFVKEKREMVKKRKLSKPPSLQELKKELECVQVPR